MNRRLVTGAVVVLVILIIGGFAGHHVYMWYSLKTALYSLSVRDNVLNEEILVTVQNSSNMTFGEYFEKAKKNVDLREQVIRDLRTVNPYRYAKEIGHYVGLLEMENEYVRAEDSWTHANLRFEAQAKYIGQYQRAGYAFEEKFIGDRFGELQQYMDEQVKKGKEMQRVGKEIIARDKDCNKELSAFIQRPSFATLLIKSGKHPELVFWVKFGATHKDGLVTEIAANGPFEKAGIKVGDKVSKITNNGEMLTAKGLSDYSGLLDAIVERDGSQFACKVSVDSL